MILIDFLLKFQKVCTSISCTYPPRNQERGKKDFSLTDKPIIPNRLSIILSTTMKFSAILLASLASTATAFSPSSNGRAIFTSLSAEAGPSTDPVDKTLKGIDAAAEHDVFDPLGGEAPALIRNNNQEVWVPQVSREYVEILINVCITHSIL